MHSPLEHPFTPISHDQVPAAVATLLLGRSSLLIFPEDAPQSITELNPLRTYAYENGELSYLASQTKPYTNGMREDIIHLIDASPGGEVIGWGEVRYDRTSSEDYFKDKPFVGMNATVPERRSQELGARRLYVMKLATVAEFGLTLHSDTLFVDPNARKIWEHMVRDGLAEEYIQHGSKGSQRSRFRFK